MGFLLKRCLIKLNLDLEKKARIDFLSTLHSGCGVAFSFSLLWIRISSRCVWTKGTHSLRSSIPSWSLSAFHPSSPSIKHQHGLPISSILFCSFLLSTDFLDIYSLSFAVFPFPIPPHITLHLCISCSCSAPTQSQYISALTHSLSLLSIQPSHFYFPLHLVPLSSQSSTSPLTLIHTGPRE